jgi:hypothetical protein
VRRRKHVPMRMLMLGDAALATLLAAAKCLCWPLLLPPPAHRSAGLALTLRDFRLHGPGPLLVGSAATVVGHRMVAQRMAGGGLHTSPHSVDRGHPFWLWWFCRTVFVVSGGCRDCLRIIRISPVRFSFIRTSAKQGVQVEGLFARDEVQLHCDDG